MTVIVAGIDPGLTATGYAILSSEHEILRSGVIRPRGTSLSLRLHHLHEELRRSLEEIRPDMISMEKVVYHKNPKTALHLGAARGVALLLAAELGLPVEEHSPTRVKRALTGTGSASKGQVAFMVKKFLQLEGEYSTDETDAMACALVAILGKRMERCSAP
jgi:crossover junction endodeoxyribonuclease RuvC